MSHSNDKKVECDFYKKNNGNVFFFNSTFKISNAILIRSHYIIKYQMRHKIFQMQRFFGRIRHGTGRIRTSRIACGRELLGPSTMRRGVIKDHGFRVCL